MLSHAHAMALAKAGFPRPRKLKAGQHWYTPEKRLGVIVAAGPDHVLLAFQTSSAVIFDISTLLYAPTIEEMLTQIARAGKHRLLGKQPGARKFEVVGVTLHQFTIGTGAANAVAKEFCNIKKGG